MFYKKQFEVCIDKWLLSKKPVIKETTYSKYITIIDSHIRPKLGNIPINKINSELLSKFVNNEMEYGNLETKGKLNNNTVREIINILKQILKYNEIYIQIPLPHSTKKDIVILSENERNKLERYLLLNNNRYTFGILLTLYTGMRIGEICALKWKNIDLKKKVITINSTISRVKNLNNNIQNKTKLIVENAKTINSIRKIPIPKSLIEILNKVKGKDEYYFLTGSEKIIDPRNYENQYKKILKCAGINENYSYHTLRHTFATRCIALGFDPKTLQEILGHSNIKITLSLYVHPTEKMKTTCMNKLILKQ